MLLKNELSSTESPNFLALEQVTLTIDMWHAHWTLYSMSQCRPKIALYVYQEAPNF